MLNRQFAGIFAALAVGLLLAAPASATIWHYTAVLDGLQETPPNASPGFGSADVDINDVANTMTIVSGTGVFSGLVAPATAGHIHGLAGPGTPAGVLIPLTVTAATSGTITGGGATSAANIAGALAGNTYINIHTSVFPGGEIRGQIIPEPMSLGLLGLAATAMLRRRR